LNLDGLQEERFSTNPKRIENREELVSILNNEFRKQSVSYWIQRFENIKIPCGPVNQFSDVLNDTHVKERDMVVEEESERLGTFKMLGLPVKLSRTPGEAKGEPPKIGEHTTEILKYLGYNPQEISQLNSEGITKDINKSSS